MRLSKHIHILAFALIVGFVLGYAYQSISTSEGKAFQNRDSLCQYFAQSYLATVRKSEKISDYESDTWQRAIDIESSLYNDCMQDIANKTVFQDGLTVRPRETIIEYRVKPGDTLASIADKFDISMDTIIWANTITNTDVQSGMLLNILPVTGIAHTVRTGDTVDSIAQMYDTDPQNIINFPYNEYKNLNTLELIPGRILYVPDGKIE